MPDPAPVSEVAAEADVKPSRGPVYDQVIPALIERFGDRVEELPTPFDIPQIRVDPSVLVSVCERLRELGFRVLVDLAGADYHPRTPRFEVVYHLMSLEQRLRIRLRVQVGDKDPTVPTVSHIWPMAHPAEREVYDLFGIRISGHPDLKRILLPDDWEGHPLRKDYPLRGPRDPGRSPQPAGERFDWHAARVTPTKGRGRVES